LKARRPPEPILPILPRYLLREFAKIFLLCMAGFVLLYLLVDFFDRLNVFLKHHAGWAPVSRYLLLKVPLILARMAPAATFAAILLSLGVLSRQGELSAMRACGLSPWQIGAPLLAAGAAISLGALAWNELVVPYCSARSHYVENTEIRKRHFRGLLSDRGIWYRGKDGIYNIEYFDAKHQAMFGLVVYDIGPGFELRRLIEVPSARWDGTRWVASKATEHVLGPGDQVTTHLLSPDQWSLSDKPSDFTLARKSPEDLSYRQLKRRIRMLRSRGIETTEESVELELKLAMPAMSLVLAIVAVPLGIRRHRVHSLAMTVATALAVGFLYYVVIALSRSLGQVGAVSPVLAAWAGNAIFTLVGIFLYLGAT